ncbi:hypothetical protein EOJ36_03760 [Sandaracinomonas limnophila]|uniref:TonB-dependent receptor n=1 Tax=Sandaracinomonas limnophila TaxID=1862386 RepID=A0A437PTE7_9BACT|nr:hypothetical protein EOJ36_03760 [Sandaracinomonas limnophila]
MLKAYYLPLLFAISFSAFSQNTSTELPDVVVHSFEKNRKKLSNPDAISHLDSLQLRINSGTSFVNVFNAITGVKMEERSPGSYRLAIRGSSLRAPFGVRNVKIYWNNISLTDAGNNTYFQLFEPDFFHQATISKGPSGGLYGAGTGGTMQLNSIINNSPFDKLRDRLTINNSYNSLGGNKHTFDLNFGNKSIQNRVYVSYRNQKGYREQSDMEKTFLSFQAQKSFGDAGRIEFLSYYGNLRYQTPGGLTLTQYLANPKQARPTVGTAKGAIDQKATFYIQSFFSALSIKNQIDNHWAYDASLGYQQNDIQNPSIRNYEIRNEPNINSRGVLHFKNDANNFSWDAGYEFLSGKFNSSTYANNLGEKGALQVEQNAQIEQYTAFFQTDYQTKNHWNFTISGSLNKLWTNLNNPETVFSPRISIGKKIGQNQYLLGKIAHGFSPPSIAEIRPSSAVLNPNLQAEKGWNHELTYRNNFTKGNWELTAYWFELQESISLRRTADGADYFENVGQTRQKGIENTFNYKLNKLLTLTAATTLQDFHFINYKSVNTNYSGNQLTGTAPFVQSFVGVVQVHPNFNIIPQFIYTDALYLNDANTDLLPASRYWNLKFNYSKKIRNFGTKIWINLDNVLNENYSSGPDLNAVGGRYYNVSMGRNFSLGLQLEW